MPSSVNKSNRPYTRVLRGHLPFCCGKVNEYVTSPLWEKGTRNWETGNYGKWLGWKTAWFFSNTFYIFGIIGDIGVGILKFVGVISEQSVQSSEAITAVDEKVVGAQAVADTALSTARDAQGTSRANSLIISGVQDDLAAATAADFGNEDITNQLSAANAGYIEASNHYTGEFETDTEKLAP